MSKRYSDPSTMAARWIDQRLRELVMHWQPLAEAIGDALDARYADPAVDKIEQRRARQLTAVKLTAERERTIHAADALLKLREQYCSASTMAGPVAGDVLRELASLRAAHEADREERAKEERWFENELEYSMECARCRHDGDVRPSRADYDLDDERENDAEGDE